MGRQTEMRCPMLHPEAVETATASTTDARPVSPKPPFEAKRLFFHVLGTGTAALASAFISDRIIQAWVIVALLSVLVITEILHHRWPGLGFLGRWFGIRPGERCHRISSGDMAVGLTIAWLMTLHLPNEVFTSIALVVAFADPNGRFFGVLAQRLGVAHHLPDGFSRKTFEGSLAVLVVACAVSIFALGLTAMVLIVGVVVALAEALPSTPPIRLPVWMSGCGPLRLTDEVSGLDDNLTMPVAAALAFIMLAA